jgi:hypothetical protein
MTSSSVTAKGTVYLPLVFFFNRNPGLALPLIALQYHEVRIDFDLASNFDSYLNTSTFKVWGNYVYLDTEERRRFAQKGHEYLIEQVQHTGTDTVTKNATKQVRLSYNHPVKELVWCVADAASDDAQGMYDLTSACTQASVDFVTVPNAVSNTYITANQMGCPALDVKTATSKVFTEQALGNLDTFKLVLNGQDRFKEQQGRYFNQVQPFQHHSGNPYAGVYSYSFALKPEEHQPTGTCNFSRIDNAQVAVKCADVGTTNKNLDMFAVNYNVLRVQSGMGGLAFSN